MFVVVRRIVDLHWLTHVSNICRDGFDQRRIDALLHSIELDLKHQSSNFGIKLTLVSVIT